MANPFSDRGQHEAQREERGFTPRSQTFSFPRNRNRPSSNPFAEQPKASSTDVAAEIALRGFASNLTDPAFYGDTLAFSAALPETIARVRSFGDVGNFLGDLDQNFQGQKQQFPASALQALSDRGISGEGLMDALPFGIGEASDNRVARLREESPGGASAGDIASDLMTVLFAKKPPRDFRAALGPRRRAAAMEDAEGFLRMRDLPPGVRERLTDTFQDTIIPGLATTGRRAVRATGKAAETGMEAAMLQILEDEDPSTMFGLGVGGQMAGSMALFLAEAPLTRLLPAIATAWVGYSMYQQLTPAEDNFFTAKDFAIDKAILGAGSGLVFGALGAGRLRGASADKFPAVFDAITAAPRVAVMNRIQEMISADDEGNFLPSTVMQKFMTQPDFFSQSQQTRLARAMMSEDENALTQEIDRLMKGADFRERVDTL